MSGSCSTYSFPVLNDSICRLEQSLQDTIEICAVSNSSFPCFPLPAKNELIGNLLYTIVFVILFAFVRLRGKDLFYNLLNLVIKRKKSEIILSEGISSNLVCYIISLFLSFSILSVYISYTAQNEFLQLFTLYIFLGLLCYYFLLLILVWWLGWAFNKKNIANEIIVNLWTYNIFTGLIISPFMISVFFVQHFAIVSLLKLVIFGLVLLFIVKIIRWIEIFFSHKVSILYMILYLCALEIMPLLILYKVVA